VPHHGGFFTVRRRAAAGSVMAAAILVACYFALSASGFGGLADGDAPAAAGGGPVGETIDRVRRGLDWTNSMGQSQLSRRRQPPITGVLLSSWTRPLVDRRWPFRWVSSWW